MKTIFLTGANGHIGSNIARELLRRGYRVVGYVRETSDLRGLHGLDLELREGDILDRDRVTRALEGCDAIIHTAAVYSVWAPDDDDIITPSIEGTDNILQAAHANGIRRVVYTSSAAAVGGSKNASIVRDEKDWKTDASMPYILAKTDSERLAVGLAAQLDLELISLNPTYVLGPYDYKPTPSTQVILNALNGSAPLWDAAVGFVHVEDVARLHVDALTMGTPGERYIVNGTTLHLREIQTLLREMLGVRTILVDLPGFIGRPVGLLLGWIGKLAGTQPLFDERIYDDVMAINGEYSNQKSVNTFGIEYMDIRTIIAHTAAWLIHAGMLKPKIAEQVRARHPAHPEWTEPVTT